MATILIVDDDIAVQATIRILLERAGHNVVVAGDGRKALAVLDAGEFDLVLLDVLMPGMDGLETMRLIHERAAQIPIIVISGRPMISTQGPSPDILTIATRLGPVRGVQKPFKPSTLLAAVADCLQAANPSAAMVSAGVIAARP